MKLNMLIALVEAKDFKDALAHVTVPSRKTRADKMIAEAKDKAKSGRNAMLAKLRMRSKVLADFNKEVTPAPGKLLNSHSGGVTSIFETLGRSVTKAILVESRR